MTTAKQVNAALKAAGTEYKIGKVKSCWYVTGGDSFAWFSRSLNTYRIEDLAVADLVEGVLRMRDEHNGDR